VQQKSIQGAELGNYTRSTHATPVVTIWLIPINGTTYFLASSTLVSVGKHDIGIANAPAVLVERSRIDSDPRQSPFWITAMGLLRWD
jgi:hypothetical protein